METQPDIRGISLEHLRAFAAVARCGSFQKAGARLCRSQSAVTQAVRRLETQLNCTLVVRGNGHMAGLTSAGERLFPEISDTLRRLDALLHAAQRPELRGRISVGIPPSFSAVELQTAIAHLSALNPGLQIEVLSDMSTVLERMLRAGHLDVALINQHRFDDARASEGIFRVLAQQPLNWVSDVPHCFTATSRVPLVTYSEGSPWRAATLNALDAAGVRYSFAYVSASYESLCSSLLAGFGVSALPGWDLTERFTLLGAESGLPPLPQVRTVLKTAASSPVLCQFCDFIANLPFFKNLEHFHFENALATT